MFSKLALIVSATSAAEWNYETNGADWPELTITGKTNECGDAAQSPINLVSLDSSDFDYKIYEADKDTFTKDYTNQFDANPAWNGHTYQTALKLVADGGTANTFSSQIAGDIFGADTTFDGQQFHFHSGSEHTVDGKRHDLEMHTVHYPPETKSGFIAAAMGIIFSVEDYTAELSKAEEMVIDTFFDSLKWGDMTEEGPTVDIVTYGNLMEMVDNKNRWIYKGSVTTPPCATAVYWNVLSTIYPVKQKHLDLFKKQLDRGEDGKLDELGNWREIQEINGQDVIYLQNIVKEDDADKGLLAGIIVLGIISLILIFTSIFLCMKIKKLTTTNVQKVGGQVELPEEPVKA